MSGSSSRPCIQSNDLPEDSLVKKLLEIKDDFQPNDKFFDWLRYLECSSAPREGHESIPLVRMPGFWTDTPRDYVAISYSRHTMAGENLEFGHYKIQPPGQDSRDSKVRDVVLSRAMRYARHFRCEYIWVDQECIKPEEMEKAINSMDVVYARSRHPVGLLASILSQSDDIELLRDLLQGRFAFEVGNRLKLGIDHCDGKVSRLMALLKRLSQDPWWKRAWIFQEEYLGGLDMMLLIPYLPQRIPRLHKILSQSSGYDRPSAIGDDICINASAFRRRTTMFLIALKAKAPQHYEIECQALLGVFGKYNVLYRYESSARGRAMSSKIFTELSKRSIENSGDFLPIVANACDYELRPKSNQLAESVPAVVLRGLALYLRNGEIIANDKKLTALPVTDNNASLSQYLNDISFDEFDPPVGDGELTWLKECRLSDVTFSERGMHTTGRMWRIYARFYIGSKWDRPRANIEDTEWQYERLRQLAGKLERAALSKKIPENDLPARLIEYLEKLQPLGRSTDGVQHMDLMANEIVRAIDDDGSDWLSLATLEEPRGDACAIFVGDHSDGSLVFTSWFSGKDKDERNRTRHVSLKVRAEENRGQRVLRVTEWVNGLALFRWYNKQEEVVFGWPEAWTQPTSVPVNDLKRQREDEHEIGNKRLAMTDSISTI